MRQPFTALSNNADTANKKLYVEIMYERPGCGDYLAMFTLVDRTGLSTPLEIDSVLNNAGTYQLSADRRALMRPTAGGYRLRFNLLGGASVRDGYRVVISTHKLAYRCAGCGAAGSDAIFEPRHVKAGCPPLEGEVLACHRRAGRMANWEAWLQDPRDCQPYRVVMMPDGRWWFAQNLRWGGLGQPATDGSGSRLYSWYEAVTGGEVPDGMQLLLTINSDEVGTQGVCPDGWHLPTTLEWHRLGVGMGSGAATPTDTWQPHALYGLMSFSWYGTVAPCAAGDGGCFFSTLPLRQANDESGFTWLPTPFEGIRGVGNGSIRHGALWSAGAASDPAADRSAFRIAAQATAAAWAASPLAADLGAGHKAVDRLPLRCTYGAGVPPTVSGTIPLPPDEYIPPCLLAGGGITGSGVPLCNLAGGGITGTEVPLCNLVGGGITGAAVAFCNLAGGGITGIAPCNLAGGGITGAAPCNLTGGGITGAAPCLLVSGGITGTVPCNLAGGGITGTEVPPCNLAGGGITGAEVPPCNLTGGGITGTPI